MEPLRKRRLLQAGAAVGSEAAEAPGAVVPLGVRGKENSAGAGSAKATAVEMEEEEAFVDLDDGLEDF